VSRSVEHLDEIDGRIALMCRDLRCKAFAPNAALPQELSRHFSGWLAARGKPPCFKNQVRESFKLLAILEGAGSRGDLRSGSPAGMLD